MTKMIRSPLVFCLVGGWIIWWFLQEPPLIVITQAQYQEALNNWQTTRGKPATQAEAADILLNLRRERVLLKAAEDAGLLSLPAIDRRLQALAESLLSTKSQNIELVKTQIIDEALLNDTVVQNYLIEAYRQHLTGQMDKHVTDVELKTMYQANLDQFKTPERRSIRHLYTAFDNNAADKDINRLKEDLQASLLGWTQAQARSDTFIAGHQFNVLSQAELSKILGDTAAEKVFGLTPAVISEAISSPFGWHLIIVDQVVPTAQKSFDEVKSLLKSMVLQQRQQRHEVQMIDGLMQQYGWQLP